MRGAVWTVQNDLQLATMLADGRKPAAIARVLDRSKDAVLRRMATKGYRAPARESVPG